MKYCPQCGAEYIDTVARCNDCDKDLVSEQAWKEILGRREEENRETFVKLCTVDDRFEADVVRDLLEKEGVPVLIRNYADTSFDGIFIPQKGWAAVLVPREKLVPAERIIFEFQKNRAKEPEE